MVSLREKMECSQEAKQVKLSATVMAHPDRQHLWEPLADSLGLPVTLDRYNSRWDTGSRSLLAYEQGATHHLVLQDDAVVPRDFMKGVERWLAYLPESVLCLYSGRLGVFRHLQSKLSTPPCFLYMNQIQWGVALVVPTKYIGGIVERGNKLSNVGNYDARISSFTWRNKIPVLYPQASWVDHKFTPSLVQGRRPDRHALEFIGEDSSLLDWADPEVGVPLIRCPEFWRTSVPRRAL
jgi:hypothetical protein